MKGQSLIEVLVALGIISIIIIAVATVVITSLNNTQLSKDQNLATKYAQEGLEITRSVRNGNFTAFNSLTGTYCLPKDAVSLGSSQAGCTLPNIDYFIRSVQVDHTPGCGTNVSKVTVTVTWRDGKCTTNTYCHKSQLETCLSRRNPVAPI